MEVTDLAKGSCLRLEDDVQFSSGSGKASAKRDAGSYRMPYVWSDRDHSSFDL